MNAHDPIAMALLVGCCIAPAIARADASDDGARPLDATSFVSSDTSVMDRRWSVSTAIGGQSVHVMTDGGPTTLLGVLELAGRFRVTPALEIGLELMLGKKNVAPEENLLAGGVFAEARYRFRAEEPLNIYSGVALGVGWLGEPYEEEQATRRALRVTILGLERRFTSFAVFGGIGVAAIASNPDHSPMLIDGNLYRFARHRVAGGTATFGSTFYF